MLSNPQECCKANTQEEIVQDPVVTLTVELSYNSIEKLKRVKSANISDTINNNLKPIISIISYYINLSIFQDEINTQNILYVL